VEKEGDRIGFFGLKAPESLKIASSFRYVEKRSRTKKKRQDARQKIKKFFASGKKLLRDTGFGIMHPLHHIQKKTFKG
jgi:hypothetical protein